MKIFLTCIFGFFLCPVVDAQTLADTPKTKAVVLELGGSAGLGSVNFEKEFNNYGNFILLGRIGLSAAPIDKNNGTAVVFPITVRGLWGKLNHYAEFGLGQGLSVTTKGQFFALTPLYCGYRFQKTGKRMFFSIGYSPLVSYILDFQWQHWGGIGIGYTLNPRKQ